MNDFESRISAVDPGALFATGVELLQLNVGLRCNLTCSHCHQSSSPARTETMSEDILEAAIRIARGLRPSLVDLTGGAPELHPRVREIVASFRSAGLALQSRTNLTVLLEPGCEDLPELWARHEVRLLASLASWEPGPVARQRGAGVFERCVEALRRLNAVGYGTTDRLRLDIAANPDGAVLPDSSGGLEAAFRQELDRRYGIRFHSLRVLTNMPLGRFRGALGAGRRDYLETLRAAFNPATLSRLACRTSLVVAWDGTLYDCDFNAGASLPILGERRSVLDFDDALSTRRIAFGAHCFGCTASAGSS